MNAILWIYYGITKPDSFLIATINGFGAVTQIVYILIFLVFISPRMRVSFVLFCFVSTNEHTHVFVVQKSSPYSV